MKVLVLDAETPSFVPWVLPWLRARGWQVELLPAAGQPGLAQADALLWVCGTASFTAQLAGLARSGLSGQVVLPVLTGDAVARQGELLAGLYKAGAGLVIRPVELSAETVAVPSSVQQALLPGVLALPHGVAFCRRLAQDREGLQLAERFSTALVAA